MEKYEHIEKFDIDGMPVELGFYTVRDSYVCDIITGDTGTGTCSGYGSLQEAITACVRQHRYSYNFFNKGYKTAKAIDTIENGEK